MSPAPKVAWSACSSRGVQEQQPPGGDQGAHVEGHHPRRARPEGPPGKVARGARMAHRPRGGAHPRGAPGEGDRGEHGERRGEDPAGERGEGVGGG